MQKRKGHNEKTELSDLKRENQTLSATCQDLENAKQKLSHDLLQKQSQMMSLEQKINNLERDSESKPVTVSYLS